MTWLDRILRKPESDYFSVPAVLVSELPDTEVLVETRDTTDPIYDSLGTQIRFLGYPSGREVVTEFGSLVGYATDDADEVEAIVASLSAIAALRAAEKPDPHTPRKTPGTEGWSEYARFTAPQAERVV